MTAGRRYFPAASLDVFLPAYDPIMRLLGFQRAIRTLLDQAGLQPEHAVLDVGCGTGTLAVLIKQRYQHVHVIGVDPDPLALARAARKASHAGVSVQFDRGFGDALPYGDGVFDRVFSSMMLHHVPKNEQRGVMVEIRRVLKPGGRLEFLDFAGGAHRSPIAHLLHGRESNASADERLTALMRAAGLVDVKRTGTRGTIAGAIAYYQASVRA